MSRRGYQVLHRSEDVGNYASDQGDGSRVGYIFARRPTSRAMLSRARPVSFGGRHDVRVVEVEDLIGLKVQAVANDPRRAHADIQRLLGSQPGLDLERVREYFRLFEREEELNRLLRELDSKQ